MRDVTIHPVLNGYVVTVGCQKASMTRAIRPTSRRPPTGRW